MTAPPATPRFTPVNTRAIWHADGARHVLLRCSLDLSGPCRDGHLTCSASGPFQLYLDGRRIAGFGQPTETAMWHPCPIEGSWDTGEHELVAVVDGGADQPRWFALHGRLEPAATATETHAVESGLHWHSLEQPVESDSADEVYNAMTDPRSGRVPWEGVVTVDALPADEAPVATERQVEAERFSAFESTHPDSGLSFSPEPHPVDGKFVHRDGLLTGPSPAASLQLGIDGAYTFVLDLGRLVIGTPNLRLREGLGGVIQLGLAASWGQIDRTLRYVCGSGRQEWFAAQPGSIRYIVVHLSGFDQECLLERIAVCERFVDVEDQAQLQLPDPHPAAWAVGPPSSRSRRQDTYDAPQATFWLTVEALLRTDLARYGHADTGRATLLARAPALPSAQRSAYAACLEQYYMWSGDEDTTRRLLPGALATIDDTLPTSQATADLATAHIHAAAARRICLHVGDDAGAQRCDTAVDRASDQLQSRWLEATGLFSDGGQEPARAMAQGLALRCGVTPEQAAAVVQNLRSAGPVGDLAEAHVLVDGLFAAGHHRRALDLVRNHWLRLVDRDGLTWHDKRGRSDLAPPPDGLLLRWILGIEPVTPGGSRMRVTPAHRTLPVVSGSQPIPNGDLQVGWKPDEDDRLEISLRSDAAETELVITRGDLRRPLVSVNGETVWRNEKMVPNPSVHELGASDNDVTLVFGRPGAWTVTVE